jgi:vacuolar-type H+-ATPase subunit F/Vma7
MKKSLVLLFLVFSLSVLAQSGEKSITLKDAATNLPIEDATVFVLKTKQTYLSNAEGNVTFLLTGSSNIQVTHSSYVSVTVRSSALLKTDNVIYLKSNVNDLDEIIVTKQHPQKILKSLVSNSVKKLTVPARLKVYCREFFKMNGNYSYYNDGLMNFQLFGNDKNFKSNILVEQNRSFGLVNEEITSDVLGYNLNGIMQNYYNFKYLNPVLEPNAKKKYDFVIKGYTANADYNVMLVTPTDNSNELRDDFKIIYDSKKKIIIEVSSAISPLTLSSVKEKTAVGSKNIYKSIFKTIYRIDNANYYLVSSKEEIGFERVDKDKKTDIEVRNYFVTTNFSNHNYSYKESEVFKDKTLYNKKNVILSSYWDVSGLTATEEEQEIVLKMADRQ